MSSLVLSFSDIYTQVSEFLGIGSSPTGTNLTKVKDIVHRGYRQFLTPVDGRTGKNHTWSFLSKESMLITRVGVNEYQLPDDYGHLWYSFTYDNDINYPTPHSTSIDRIRVLLSLDTSNSYPQLYSIVSDVYDSLVGQRYKVVFYPKLDDAYLLRYGYVIEPPKLVNDTDLFIGEMRTSEAILETCLAVAEQQEDDTIGIHTQLAAKLTNDLIRADVKQVPDSVGLNLDRFRDPTLAREMRYYPDPVSIYNVSL